MNQNKAILSLLLVTVVVSLGLGTSYAQTDDQEAELEAQIERLTSKLLRLQDTQAYIADRIEQFETKKDDVQASLDKLRDNGGSEEKINKRLAKIDKLDEKIAKLELAKTQNEEKIDNVESKIAAKESELRSSATQPARSERVEAPVLARSYSTSSEGATGASSHVPAQITEFRAIFTPHHAGNASPQAGASWIEPDDNTITEYKLEHQLLNEADWTEVRLLHGNNSHYIDAEYDSTYSFRISAINDNGSGLVSVIQNVTVVDFSEPDDTPPVFGPVKNIVYSTSDDIADLPLFTYLKPIATDAVDGPVEVKCNPDSPPHIGVNEIFCYADDSDGNRAHTSFTIRVPALDPIDCTIDVMMGSVKEFHPSECDVRYNDILLDDIPRSMLYGTAEISDNLVVITPPDVLPDLTPSTPSQAILDHLNITSDQFVPKQAMPESFGLTISPIYGADRPRIDVTVNYTSEEDVHPLIGTAVDENLYPLDGVVITEITVKIGTTEGSGFGGTGGDNFLRIDLDHLFGITDVFDDITLSGVNGTAGTDVKSSKIPGFFFTNDAIGVYAESDGEFDITYTPTCGRAHTITVKVETDVANTTPSATVTGVERKTGGSPPTPPTVTNIAATGTANTTITETIAVTNVPIGYNFTSVTRDSALETAGVSISGIESGGTISVSIGLPSAQATITGNIVVSYCDGTHPLTSNSTVSLTVNPAIVDPPTIQNIAVNGTGGTSETHTLQVSDVPSGYNFVSATPDSTLSTANVTASGAESGGTITITFGLPSVSSSTEITGDLSVRYSNGTTNLDVTVPVTLTVNPPDSLTVTNVLVSGGVDTTVTETILVSNVPSGYSFTNATADAALTTAGVSISGTESRGEITVSIGLPSTQTNTPITGNIIVSYGDGTNTLTANSTATITVVPASVLPSPEQLPLLISADGTLADGYLHTLSDGSAEFFFPRGAQFTPVPSNIVAGITSPVNTDFAYSLFIGDRSTAFTTDQFFEITMYETESNVVPNYYASDPTVLVPIPLCVDESFDGNTLAGNLIACYESNVYALNSITIYPIQSGNYVLVPRS